jgi:hypothetical protein
VEKSILDEKGVSKFPLSSLGNPRDGLVHKILDLRPFWNMKIYGQYG